MNRSSLSSYMLSFLVAAIGIWACPGCSGGDSGSVPLTDEDGDIEYSEWEVDPDAENGDSPADGDNPDGDIEPAEREWDRVEPREMEYDSVSDTQYSSWKTRSWQSSSGNDTPEEVRSILPRIAGGAFIGASNGLFVYDPNTDDISRVPYPDGVTNMDITDMEFGYDDTLFIIASTNLPGEYLFSMRYDNVIRSEDKCILFDSPISLAIKGSSRILYIGTSSGVYEFNNTDCQKKSNYPSGWIIDMDGEESNRMAVIKGGVSSPNELHILDGQWYVYTVEDGLTDGALMSVQLYEEESGGRREVWISSDNGVQMLDSRRVFHTFAPEPCRTESASEACSMPVELVRKIALAPDGSTWAATEKGVYHYDEGAGVKRWKAFYSRRWLPEDLVTSIGFDREDNIWLGHSEGLTQMTRETWTLKRKADLFMDTLRQRHIRMGGFSARVSLPAPGDTESCSQDESACPAWQEANESLWTGMYALAETFRAKAALNQQERNQAADNAWASVRMIMELEKATQVPGLPARSILPRGEGPINDPEAGEWNRSDFYDWLGDTSSDSIVGHLLVYPFYYDLLANDEQKAKIAETFGRIAKHIIDFDWQLIDIDGEPTEWGHWDDEWVHGELGALGGGGLQALELLALLRAAYHVTGDTAFWDAYIDRAYTAGYAEATRHQKKMTSMRMQNHSDDQLAFLSYLVLLRYSDIVDFRSIYMDSIREAWEEERPESSPLFNFIYGVSVGSDFDLQPSVNFLRAVYPDLIDWRIDTCWRKDAEIDDTPDRGGKQQLTTVLPVDERKLIRFNANPYECQWADDDNDSTGGWTEDDGVFYLLPYWMGRYYGMIGAPVAD